MNAIISKGEEIEAKTIAAEDSILKTINANINNLSNYFTFKG